MRTYIVDSFTDVPFKGNPAGVCLTVTKLTDSLMLQIAQELGLSETAFVRHIADSTYRIRYFSPKMEIPLCGHATLAAAKIVFDILHAEQLQFITGQGVKLPVFRQHNGLSMNFPVYECATAEVPPLLLKALGIEEVRNSVFNAETRILLLEIDSTEALAQLQPDFPALTDSHQGINGVLVTAASTGDGFDFHSRYFWPWSGTNEDPVTGGTHTFLAPYWAIRLDKTRLKSFQSSQRTGCMEVELCDDQTLTITGNAVIVFGGDLLIELPSATNANAGTSCHP